MEFDCRSFDSDWFFIQGSAGESTSKAKKAFPTSVYLDKLAGSDEITSPERRISTNSDDIFGEDDIR